MKLTNMGLIFAMIFICLAVILDHRMDQIYRIGRIQLEYNQGIDNSLEAAMDRLVEVDDSMRARINKDEAIEYFFRNLAIHFHIIENDIMIHKLKGHVPVIAIILEDGLYIYYDKEIYENGTKVIQKGYSKKIPYEYRENQYRYFFTLSDYIRVWDMDNGERYQGKYKDIVVDGEVDILKGTLGDEKEFQRIRRTTIINILKDTIEFYINSHNNISSHYGIEYEFYLPTIEEEDWYRTIDDISMIAFLQGYPYGYNTTKTYNRYAIAGARIHK